MNGYTAADMSTAAGNGHRDGYQAGYADAVKAYETAAAQESVDADRKAIRMLVSAGLVSEAKANEALNIAHGFQRGELEPAHAAAQEAVAIHVNAVDYDGATLYVHPPIAKRGDTLYLAAPVAAAPADLSAWAAHYSINPAAVEALQSMLASTPAAPGIDLPTPRNRDEAMALAKLALAYLGVVDAHIDAAIARCQTDASPKGVVFENHGDSEANFIADGERLNCPACGGSGHVDDSPKGGSGERARFEAWAKSRSYSVDSYGQQYVESITRKIWAAWKAAMQATSAEGGSDAPAPDHIDADNGLRSYPWTYQNQPGNLGASALGECARLARPGGDSIDHGLSLLRELHVRGFGIVRVEKLATIHGAGVSE